MPKSICSANRINALPRTKWIAHPTTITNGDDPWQPISQSNSSPPRLYTPYEIEAGWHAVPTLQAFSFAALTVASRRYDREEIIFRPELSSTQPTASNGLSPRKLAKRSLVNGSRLPEKMTTARNDRPLCFECVTDMRVRLVGLSG